MSYLIDFKEIKLSEIELISFTGGTGGHIGCVGCDGKTEACMSSTTCDDITCEKGNDVGGTKAKKCGSSALPFPVAQ